MISLLAISPGTAEYLPLVTLFKDVVLALAAFTTSSVAIVGLNKWQKELAGKAGFDIARQLVKSTYALRDAIDACRSEYVFSWEFPSESGEGKADETSRSDARVWSHIFQNRWEPVKQALREFRLSAVEAEALWGKEAKEKTNELCQCAISLSVDIQYLIEDKGSGGHSFKDMDLKRDVEAGVWRNKGSGNNALTQRIELAVQSIEDFVKPYLIRR